MRVVALRRYPVKSCGGEALTTVEVDRRGLVGDRGWAVVDGDGKFASGKDTRRFRRHDAVFTLAARLAAPVPEVLFPARGWLRVDDPGANQVLSAHLGGPMTFAPEGEVSHQDAGQVSLVGTATLGAMARAAAGSDAPGDAAIDPRRLRVNVVVETSEPWVEETWVGGEVTVGGVVLRPVSTIERCRMVDIAQDSVPARPGFLKAIGAARGLQLAVYADVSAPGKITLGDAVSV